MKIAQAINLALDTLRQTTDSELTSDNVEIVQIPVSTGTFYKLSHEEVERYLSPTVSEKKE